MAAWSSLRIHNIAKSFQSRVSLLGSHNKLLLKDANYMPRRWVISLNPRHMIVRENNYYWANFKNLLHIYVLLGMAPSVLLGLYANIFIGPAKLAIIPEGYEPKHWEYYEHPISRFLARYVFPSPQEKYEKNLHHLFVAKEKQLLTLLTMKIERLMKEETDYQMWYFIAPPAKILRHQVETLEETYYDESGKRMRQITE